MALTAAAATAVAIWCAAISVGLSPVLAAAAAVPGLALAALHPDRRDLPHGLDGRRLAYAFGALGLLLYLTRGFGATSIAQLGYVPLIAAVLTSALWPATTAIRISLVLAAVALAGSERPLTTSLPLVFVFAAAAAAALVGLHRRDTPGPRAGRGRIGREAAALAAVAVLIGLLGASLLPPPRQGRGTSQGNRAQAAPQARYLSPTTKLDAGGTGSGKGKTVLFRVTASESGLWRTETFDTYDGRTWSRSDSFIEGRGFPLQGSDVFVEHDDGGGYGAGGILEQRVRVEAPVMALVAGASSLRTVELPDGFRARAAGDGTVLPLPSLGKGARYVARSLVPPSDAEILAAGSLPVAPGGVDPGYLELPAVPERVRDLATQVTTSAATPYTKARALNAWFVENTTVSNGTAALAAGADPVDQYLFGGRTGSSEAAASAEAVMLRTLGVPTRLAVGFLPGQWSVLEGDFVVRARDAHAWVEAWFPEAGWVAFDPSGRYVGPAPARDSVWQRLWALLRALWWVLLLVAAAAAAFLARRVLRRRRELAARPWATRTYERVVRAGGRHGRPRSPPETPEEYCRALAGTVPDRRLAEVGELISVGAWSRHEPPPAAQAWAEEVVTATERSAPSRRELARRERLAAKTVRSLNKPAG